MSKKSTLPAVISVLEGIEENGQRALQTLLKNSLYKKSIKVDPAALELLADVGLVNICDGAVCFCPDLDACRKKTYTYLLRKYEVEDYLDDNLEPHSIPYGSTFSATVTPDKVELCVEFPDDDVTELLDHYGVNRCRGWSFE